MRSWPNLRSVGIAFALSLPMFLTGCGLFVERPPLAVAPQLPDLPDNLAQPCRDPGVRDVQTVADATSAIADNRRFAACANRQHRDTIRFYEAVRDGLSGNPQ